MGRRLEAELIDELIQAAIRLGFYDRRDLLLVQISREFQSKMPLARDRMGDQLVRDLNYLNEVGILTDRSDPLRTWLRNAVVAAGGVQEEALFRKAISELDRLSQEAADVSEGHSGATGAHSKPSKYPHSNEMDASIGERSRSSVQKDPKLISMVVPWMGETVLNVIVTRWLKKPGDWVKMDEILLVIATDKIDFDLPSPATGYLRYIDVPEDETVEVGARLALIEEVIS